MLHLHLGEWLLTSHFAHFEKKDFSYLSISYFDHYLRSKIHRFPTKNPLPCPGIECTPVGQYRPCCFFFFSGFIGPLRSSRLTTKLPSFSVQLLLTSPIRNHLPSVHHPFFDDIFPKTFFLRDFVSSLHVYQRISVPPSTLTFNDYVQYVYKCFQFYVFSSSSLQPSLLRTFKWTKLRIILNSVDYFGVD